MKIHWKNIICTVVLICGMAFVCLGITRGELAVLLRKATTVCLECIGIG